MKGKSTRIGTYKCYVCRKQFTVKISTIFESSYVKMHLWLQAICIVAASKKDISANQLHRTLGVMLQTIWFVGHRIRLAMLVDDGEQSRLITDKRADGVYKMTLSVIVLALPI